jgi:hypothetical protein
MSLKESEMAKNNTTEIVENTEVLDEAGSADTLKPGAGSGGGDLGSTKSAAMAAVMSALGGMSKDDINNFAATLSQFGPNKDLVSAGNAAANKSSISTKPSAASSAVKEDVAELFGEEDLTEDFREKASTLFEAALNVRIGLEETRLQEEFETKLEEALAEQEEALVTRVDQYLDYVVEQWMEDNKLAIEASLRTDVTEGFIDGLKNLFAEHYMELPEERLDVVGDLAAQVEELTAKLDESITKTIELEKIVNEATAEAIFDEVSEGLAATQTEKLRTLVEGVDYADAESYRKKVGIIKENYFSDKKTAAPVTGLIVEETVSDPEALTEEGAASYAQPDAAMSRYISAINSTVKK